MMSNIIILELGPFGARVFVNIVVIYVSINVCICVRVHTWDFHENALLDNALKTERKTVKIE